METTVDERWRVLAWPKQVTELHVHLGGSVPLYRLWEIAVERGIRGLGGGYEEFVRTLSLSEGGVKDLDTYLEVYDKVELIQSGPSAVRESILIALHRAYLTGGMTRVGMGGEGGDPDPLFHIRRIELRFNPLKRTGAVFLKGKHAGLYDVDRIIRAAISAVEEVELAFRGGLQAGLIFVFGRDMAPEANLVLAEKTRLWRERSDKIIGVDVAGNESINSFKDAGRLAEIKDAFNRAGKNLGRTVHAGETPHVDLETFLATVEAIEPARVAHPIVAFRAWLNHKDDRGLRLIKERKIVCELCVKSNLLTRAVTGLEEYGEILRTLDYFEIPYTFSTDAPSLQGASLAQELLLLLDHGAATPEQVLRALRVAEEVSFLPKTAR